MDLTKVIYAVFLQFLGLYFKFLLRKPKVELAFLKSSKLYSLNGHILEQVKTGRDNPYLGLQISEDMKWSTQINNTAKKKSQFNLGLPKKE
jgi:hypothetical protein